MLIPWRHVVCHKSSVRTIVMILNRMFLSFFSRFWCFYYFLSSTLMAYSSLRFLISRQVVNVSHSFLSKRFSFSHLGRMRTEFRRSLCDRRRFQRKYFEEILKTLLFMSQIKWNENIFNGIRNNSTNSLQKSIFIKTFSDYSLTRTFPNAVCCTQAQWFMSRWSVS